MNKAIKRFLSLFLAAAMVCSLMVFTAPTASAAGYDGNPALAALQAELYEASGAVTVTMTANITIGEGENLVVPPEVTLNLGSHTLTNNGTMLIYGTMSGGTLSGSGKATTFTTDSSPKLWEITKSGSTITIPDGVNPDDALVFTGTALDGNDWTKLKSHSVHLYLGGVGADVPAAAQGGKYLSVSGPAAINLGKNAFLNCTSLTSVSLPGATGIGNNAFASCTSLTSLNLPVATTIGDYAFISCTSLTDLSLQKAETIGDGAFWNCTKLHTVSLPSVTSIIAENPFQGCISLRAEGVTLS